ncbi:MAG: YicC family protein [Gammaproteobacteria bacterium]|nr:YicC family protein [Gammaproteobacteria bacterium]
MMFSMTAFARSQGDHARFHLVWELRSVNHRYLETQFRLPDAFRNLEQSLRDTARRHLRRGKLDATLRFDRAAREGAFEINRPLLLQLLASLEQVRRDAPDIGSISPVELMKWPGVLQDASAEDDALLRKAGELFEQALGDLISARQREGAAIHTTVEDRLKAIDSHLSALRTLADQASRDLLQKLRGRINELAVEVDPLRLEQEVALIAQRGDVAEEIDRLGIHVEECRRALCSNDPQGRRLDFLTQEMNRETNTLGAKSSHAEVSQRVVDLKVIVEQIREQVQNIE